MICEVDMSTVTKSSILKMLKEQELFVSFENKDGNQRRMLCTLKPSYLADYVSKGKDGNENDDLVKVWDIENKGFRAFKISTVDKIFVI